MWPSERYHLDQVGHEIVHVFLAEHVFNREQGAIESQVLNADPVNQGGIRRAVASEGDLQRIEEFAKRYRRQLDRDIGVQRFKCLDNRGCAFVAAAARQESRSRW